MMNPQPEALLPINLNIFALKDQILSINIPQQQYHPAPLQVVATSNKQPQQQLDLLALTTRSNDSQFLDWQITTIRSGKFVFQELNKPINDLQNTSSLQSKDVRLSPSLQHKTSLVKLVRYQSIGKPQKYHSKQKSISSKTQENALPAVLNQKLLKIIFIHFCKFNYISSIKSTLFEDKQKSMSEMSLNKWMVFCKQFDLFSKLCSFKLHLKEQLKLKAIKQVQNCLSSIFKKASQSKSKMNLSQFIQAIKLLYEKFKIQSSESSHLSELDFLSTYLYCSSQAQCQKKLSTLKFTFGTPQIDFAKKSPLPIHQTLSKSRFDKSQSKENNSRKAKATNSSRKQSHTAMNLNPIISKAKSSFANLKNRSILQIHRNYISNTKLAVDSLKRQSNNAKKIQNKFFDILDSSQDDILQSYFKAQKLANLGQ